MPPQLKNLIDFLNKPWEYATDQLGTVDCKSPEGIVTGILDGMMAQAQAVLIMLDQHPELARNPHVVEAFKDFTQDKGIKALIDNGIQALLKGDEL